MLEVPGSAWLELMCLRKDDCRLCTAHVLRTSMALGCGGICDPITPLVLHTMIDVSLFATPLFFFAIVPMFCRLLRDDTDAMGKGKDYIPFYESGTSGLR